MDACYHEVRRKGSFIAPGKRGRNVLHTCRQIAKQYHLDPRIVRAEIRSGRLPAVRVGQRHKVADAVLRAWVEGRLTPPLVEYARPTPTR